MSDLEKRKFINPTPGWVGCTIINEEGKREGFPVEPGGGFVWLSEQEERLTAEATRLPQDNPFVKAWERQTGVDAAGDPITVTEHGTLVLADDSARPTASSRFTPSQAAREAQTVAEEPVPPPPPREDGQEAQEGEQTGDDNVPEPTGPPPEGKPAPGEVVATPEAVKANDETLAARAAAAKVPPPDAEKPTPVTERPAGTEAIGTPATREPAPLPV